MKRRLARKVLDRYVDWLWDGGRGRWWGRGRLTLERAERALRHEQARADLGKGAPRTPC